MKLGVIGCGKMGSALVGGIIEAGISRPDSVRVFDTYRPAAEAIEDSLGVVVADSHAEVVAESPVVLLCLKPQGFIEMLDYLGRAENRLLISIAAGIRINAIEAAAGPSYRVVRVMPNTPALIGKGASAYALGESATEDDAAVTEALLGAVGQICRVAEADLDAVTALSGSGPAYVFFLIESLVSAGIAQGLSPEIASQLAAQTVAGAAELLLQSEQSPTQLRENVTSPNGTTFAALESLRANEFERIIGEAVTAAAARSRELGES